MFPAEKKGEWEPYKVREKIVAIKHPTTNGVVPNGDTEMKDGAETGEEKAKPENRQVEEGEGEQEQVMYEEDVTSDEGAVYPIRNGAIVEWSCFLALLTHIYNTLSPPFHTPIMLIAQPVWTARDRETLTQFVFEKFKTPAFCLLDSALAVCYAYGTANATVIDIGYGKADVTAVTDFVVNDHGRGLALVGCGGEAMTDRLEELLSPKGFTRAMCEQLKKTNICEILPPGTPLPRNPASQKPDQASDGSDAASRLEPDMITSAAPGRGPDLIRDIGNVDGEDDEGVLDVATIVSGNTSEFLAKREREKAERAAARKAAAGESGSGKPVRLPNSKKEKATFQFQEFVKVEPKRENTDGRSQYILQKRDVEVGIERFLTTTPSESKLNVRGSYGILDTLAAQVHHTILSVPDTSKRSELWDSLIILGNGSKIKG
jgi:actin-related protein 9